MSMSIKKSKYDEYEYKYEHMSMCPHDFISNPTAVPLGTYTHARPHAHTHTRTLTRMHTHSHNHTHLDGSIQI